MDGSRLARRGARSDTREVLRRNVGTCENCHKEQPTWALTKCHICGHVSCFKCAAFAYGRFFCSKRCAQYFFHAEGEEDDEPNET